MACARSRGIQQQRDLYADPEWAEQKRAQHREWHFERGWKVCRLRHLEIAREQVTQELVNLERGGAG